MHKLYAGIQLYLPKVCFGDLTKLILLVVVVLLLAHCFFLMGIAALPTVFL